MFLVQMVQRRGNVVKSFVHWFLFAVTAISCLCAALYCMLTVEELSLPEMQLNRASITGRTDLLCHCVKMRTHPTAIISASFKRSSYCICI